MTSGEFLLYVAIDDTPKHVVRLVEVDKPILVKQKQIADLLRYAIRSISEYVHNVFEDGRPLSDSAISNIRIARVEDKRRGVKK